MSKLYEISIEITDYKARRLKQIERACGKEWPFQADDFTCDRQYDPPSQKLRRARKVVATAQGSLCLGEQEHEFANRLVRGIWKANGGYCYVEVRATYLENLPYETYTFDEDDFKFMTDC